MQTWRTWASVVVGAGLVGCGGAVGEQLRPEEQTANEALNVKPAACTGTAAHARPLIVDWDPDARVDLEASMKNGVVVVKYDCETMTILPGCAVKDAAYTYAGVSRKEQVVQMKSMDDLQANVPVSSGKLGAELKSGRAIDVAMVMVGKRSTTVATLAEDLLTGDCGGATHYVRSASVGAFSMATGAVGKAAAVAEMFGIGAAAQSESERKALNRDGSLEACRSSDPDEETPPSECQAPIRLQLVPITKVVKATVAKGGEAKGGEAKDKNVASEENPCPPGYVFADEICTVDEGKPFLCKPDDGPQCKTQCEAGHPGSCLNYGNLVRQKNRAKGPLKAYGAALPFFVKSCRGDSAEGCAALSLATEPDYESPRIAELAKSSYDYAAKACDLGSAVGCERAADMYMDADYKLADANPRTAYQNYLKACNLGRGISCWSAAQHRFKGQGIDKDPVAGLKLLTKACVGGSVDECNDAENVLEEGRYGLPKNLDMAFKFNAIACKMSLGYCIYAANTASKMGRDKVATGLY
ncbi:MAG: tetratricopeptide repeat protein, partial [Myxococcota bacterium]